MFQDICFPQNNENEFVDVALKLNTKALIFAYEFKDLKTFEAQKKELMKINALKVDIGVIVNEKTINKVSMLNEYILCKTPSLSLIEHKKSHVLFDFELQEKNDFFHHRNSGLNQVMCNLIKEKEKVVGISFSSLLNARNKGLILGRIQQNSRFIRKYKLNFVVASFAKTPFELRAESELTNFKRILRI